MINKTNADLVKVAAPFDVAGCLDNVHAGVLVGGGVGLLHGTTVGWWVWENEGVYSVVAVIPSHISAEYCADSREKAEKALEQALGDLEFILPNVEAWRARSGSAVSIGC